MAAVKSNIIMEQKLAAIHKLRYDFLTFDNARLFVSNNHDREIDKLVLAIMRQ